MPIPQPKAGEEQDAFISRCMSDEAMKKEYPDQKQRSGVCFSQWRRKEVMIDTPLIVEKSFDAFLPITKSYLEKDANGNERKFIKVTVTGIREDRDGERLSKEACESVINQLKSGKVPVYGNHGRDEIGMRSYRWQDMLGKWVNADWKNDFDVEAVMQLNEANPDAEKLWKYVHEQGMPVGFSIGGKLKESDYEEVEE